MRTTITSAQIPKQIPKHVRARLLKAQRENCHANVKALVLWGAADNEGCYSIR